MVLKALQWHTNHLSMWQGLTYLLMAYMYTIPRPPLLPPVLLYSLLHILFSQNSISGTYTISVTGLTESYLYISYHILFYFLSVKVILYTCLAVFQRSVLDASPVEPWGEIFASTDDCKKALRTMPGKQAEGT